MKLLTDISEYYGIIDRYDLGDVLSNDYLQHTAADMIMSERLYADCYDHNAFLFVKEEVGMRVYYYINDIGEKADFSTYRNLVTEIIFRGDWPEEEIEYLSRCGFRMNLIRDQYSGVYKDLAGNVAFVPGVRIEKARNMADVKKACDLFNDAFDHLSGNFITENEYPGLLDSGNILIAWNADRSCFLGALHQMKERAINVLAHVAVMKNARRQGVGRALLDAFVERNKNTEKTEKTRYMLWVQRQNEAAVRMYLNSGFRFINKSALSLIK